MLRPEVRSGLISGPLRSCGALSEGVMMRARVVPHPSRWQEMMDRRGIMQEDRIKGGMGNGEWEGKRRRRDDKSEVSWLT